MCSLEPTDATLNSPPRWASKAEATNSLWPRKNPTLTHIDGHLHLSLFSFSLPCRHLIISDRNWDVNCWKSSAVEAKWTWKWQSVWACVWWAAQTVWTGICSPSSPWLPPPSFEGLFAGATQNTAPYGVHKSECWRENRKRNWKQEKISRRQWKVRLLSFT